MQQFWNSELTNLFVIVSFCIFWDGLIIHVHNWQQWLVTEKARQQWQKYRAMLDDAMAKKKNSSVETAMLSGILSLLYTHDQILFYLLNDP